MSANIVGNITGRKAGFCGKKSNLKWQDKLPVMDIANSNNLRSVNVGRGRNRRYPDHRDWKKNRRKVLRRRICGSILVLVFLVTGGARMFLAGEQVEFSEVDYSMPIIPLIHSLQKENPVIH